MNVKQREPRHVWILAVFILICAGLFLLNQLITPPEISQDERRKLAEMPELTLSAVLSAEYMDQFETFAADSFTARPFFRTLRALSVFYLFDQEDKSGLFLTDGIAGKFEPIDPAAYRRTAAKIRQVSEQLTGLNLYYSVIPDKSFYLGAYPGFDPRQAQDVLAGELPGLTYIDISADLRGEDYYKTDLHWNQTKITGVATALRAGMERDLWQMADLLREARIVQLAERFGEERTVGDFRGVYPGQLALPLPAEPMTYREDSHITAQYLNTNTLEFEAGEVYWGEGFAGRDPYDFFLKGAQPVIVLNNTDTAVSGSLIVFRDSFSSALAPLLAQDYSQVTLIDLRYVHSRILSQFVTFAPGSDALFLFSPQIWNAPDILLTE
jgi:hypothetical protein